MKRISFLLGFMFVASVCLAQSADSLRLATLEQKVVELEATLANQGVKQSQANATIGNLQKEVKQIKTTIKTVGDKADANTLKISEATLTLDAKIDTTDRKVDAKAVELAGRTDTVEKTVKDKSLWGIIALAVAFVISVTLCIILHLNGKKSIESLRKSADKINEEIVSKASVEIAEMQKIATSIGSLSAAGASSESEQQLIKTLADRITFMEMTLYKMDSSVRGHKQLSKSIVQMKDNMLANGYEIVDMLGKPYHEGMKVTANFIEDEELEQGKQVITGIIKPQINYKGEMIQAAQITVSQNI